jgi:hypothetical protein
MLNARGFCLRAMPEALGFLLAIAPAGAQEGVHPAAPRADTISITVREGTALALDLSRDGRTIVHDLLGQLCLMFAG